MADTSTLVDQLSGLTILEVADLVKKLEEKWGVSAAAPVAAVAAPGAGGAAAAPVEEKTAFDVVLKEAGAEQDRGHQGSARGGAGTRPCRCEGPCGERAQASQGRCHQGRSRGDQEKDRSGGSQGRDQVIPRKHYRARRRQKDFACRAPICVYLYHPISARFTNHSEALYI